MAPRSAALDMRPDPAPLKRKIAAILAADVAGYSRLVAEDEERTLRQLADAREVFDARVAKAGGRIFNTAGDSVMCEFDSAVEAVRAAVDIQEELRDRNAAEPAGRRLEFRIGITIGDVVERGGDLLGDGVNIAARLEGLSAPGGICVSRSVHEAVANKLPVAFRELGPRQVKNIPYAIHAFAVEPPGQDLRASDPILARGRVRTAASNGRSTAEPGRPKRAVARRLVVVGAIVAGLFVGLPALRAVRRAIDSVGTPTSTVATRPEMASPATPPVQETSGGQAPSGGQASPAAQAPPAADAPSQPVRGGRASGPDKPAGGAPPRQRTARPDPARPPEGAAPPKTAEPARQLPADPAAAYAALAREDLVADARSLPEFYHNARYLEGKGDRTGALSAYAAAAPLAGQAIDPLLRYGALLRAAKGAAVARQAFAALARTAPPPALPLVATLLGDGEERRTRIEAFANAHPDDAAADYLLAGALMEGREGGPTLTERRLAFDALDRFLEAAAAGSLAGRFVDRPFLDGWLDDARRRRGEIESFFLSASTRPAASFTRTNSGWIARITLPETATGITVRLGEQGASLAAEPTRAGSDARDRAQTVAEVDLPASAGRETLYVGYRDRAGREAGPFPLPFDPVSATQDGGRAALERYPESWVSFRPDIPDLLSFAGLVSNRCAIKNALIGFGDETPRDALALPPCDATGPTSMPSGASLLKLPAGTESVQLQLIYADGTESQVRTFRRP